MLWEAAVANPTDSNPNAANFVRFFNDVISLFPPLGSSSPFFSTLACYTHSDGATRQRDSLGEKLVIAKLKKLSIYSFMLILFL
jgi:hypothetical protein